MKAAEWYFIMLYKVVLPFDSVEQRPKLTILLYKLALTFESVDEILKCDRSSESY